MKLAPDCPFTLMAHQTSSYTACSCLINLSPDSKHTTVPHVPSAFYPATVLRGRAPPVLLFVHSGQLCRTALRAASTPLESLCQSLCRMLALYQWQGLSTAQHIKTEKLMGDFLALCFQFPL